MKSKLAKGLLLAVVFVTMMFCLVACRKETECAFCKEVKECDQYEVAMKEVYICDDCYAEMEAFVSMFSVN